MDSQSTNFQVEHNGINHCGKEQRRRNYAFLIEKISFEFKSDQKQFPIVFIIFQMQIQKSKVNIVWT